MATTVLNALVVDGNPALRDRLQKMLVEVSAGAMTIDCAGSIAEATDKLTAFPFDLCLLDYHLGRDSGFEMLRQGQSFNQRTAFIILAESASKTGCYTTLHHGAMDYLIKDGLDGFGLTKSMAFSLFRKSKEMELEAIALRDPLTGIGNRTLFAEQGEILTRLALRTRGRIGVLFMDIDGLKPVNDRHGHEVGDKLLQVVSHRISERLRKSDIIARMGGTNLRPCWSGSTPARRSPRWPAP
ncbi:PAS/PAC sensor-containing diguanylate cyclase/phosphodiesterase (fragment) [Candidatus Terasakiella magnetica]